MEVVSFIIPNRGGKDLDIVIANINKVYASINKEIIVVEQSDNRPFMRGQLYNIGAKFATGNYFALTDNDIYHLRELPLFLIYSIEQCPLVCFKYISQLSYDNGRVQVLVTEERPYGFGAFTFLTKSDFFRVNGFSNLYIGWGAEDKDFITRFSRYVRIPQNLGHLQHPKRINTNPVNTRINHSYLQSAASRSCLLDGAKQTTYRLVSEHRDGNVLYISVDSISVVDSFKYVDLLSKHYQV